MEIENIERMSMPKDQKDRETVTVEQLALSNAYKLEAMINVLERRGLLIGKEVLDEMEVIVVTKGKEESNDEYR